MTEAIKTILTREINEAENIRYCQQASSYFVELTNFSTITFHKLAETTFNKYKENENIALPFQLLLAIELVDAIQELIRLGISNPSTLLVRSLFEVYLNIRILIEDMSKFTERSITWLYFCAKQNIKEYRNLIKENLEEINNRNEIKIEINFEEVDLIARGKIRNLDSLLTREQFNFISHPSSNKKCKNWYALIGKQYSNSREVAKKFGCELEYVMLYQPYSKYLHGTDYQKYIKRMSVKENNDYILRDRNNLTEVIVWTGNWMVTILRLVYSSFMPDEMKYFQNWYMNNFRGFITEFRKIKFLPE